jgi:hypothetical protein
VYQAREDIYELQDTTNESSGPRTLQLTQDIGGTLEVYVAEFKPLPGDKTANMWERSGRRQCLDMPPYALTELERVKINVQKYAYDHYLDYLAGFAGADELVSQTIGAAVRYSKSKRVSGCIDRKAMLIGCRILWFPRHSDCGACAE